MMLNKIFFIGLLLFAMSCTHKSSATEEKVEKQVLKVGAENTSEYLSDLQGKNVAIVTNQTGVLRLFDAKDSVIGQKHLVDFLLEQGIDVKVIFAPEHGFRGEADAGEQIADGKDSKTGLPVYSLHGKHKKPQAEQLTDIDVLLFDIQDVGVRFYTYISTLHYVMESAVEQNIPLIVLDRPNPNGHYVDGPVMEEKYQSFLGMHPVPVVYGMTIGEYALMINGEGWLEKAGKADLKIVSLKHWEHKDNYSLPIKPSPNLPNDVSINLYPSICFFEQTNVSIGRGTDFPFQVYGSPHLNKSVFEFSFTPRSVAGAKYPKHEDMLCYGEDLRAFPERLGKLDLQWLIKAYENTADKEAFFKRRLEYLAGTKKLREQIIAGKNQEEIRSSWQEDLQKFNKIRKKYLLYTDFQ